VGQDVGSEVAFVAEKSRLKSSIFTGRIVHFPGYMPVMAMPADRCILLRHRDVGGQVTIEKIDGILSQHSSDVTRQEVQRSQNVHTRLDMRGGPPGESRVRKAEK